jgi:hypothetical protein
MSPCHYPESSFWFPKKIKDFLFNCSLNFQWLVLDIIGITLTASNLLGYLRCKFGNANSVTSLANNYVRQQMFSSMFNMFSAKAGAAPAQTKPNQFI